MKTVVFKARRTVVGDPFEATEAGLRGWFEQPESITALCSMADEYRVVPPNRVEVVSRIPFPGMTAKSVTVLEVLKDLKKPSFDISTVSSTTVCETGPKWIRDLLVSLLDSTKSTSENTVTVEMAGEGTARVTSDVTLKVEIDCIRCRDANPGHAQHCRLPLVILCFMATYALTFRCSSPDVNRSWIHPTSHRSDGARGQ